MKYRKMGKHGIKLSEISIGTMYYGSYIKKEAALACLTEALNQGINFIDCADRYGIDDSELPINQRMRAEIILGEFLLDQDRDDLVISSKVFKQLRESPNSGGLSRKHIRESIRDSLKYLQSDYLDIYYCHRPDRETPLEETIRTMTNLIEEGLVHYWGTSWWPPFLVERTIGIAKEHGLIPPAVEEPPYHINARFIEVELFDVAKYHGLGITAFEALASGFYTGKYLDSIPKDSRFSIEAIWKEIPKDLFEKRKAQLLKLMEIAKSIEIPLSQLALAWVLRRPEITSTIMGASKPEQVTENAAASDVTLDEETLDKIEKILDNIPTTPFRQWG
ncbi:MAG: aldo/keto reductase [Candidatus Heimdallarchaeota archaeon]|nr:MAG: aldo/keto reductase [Candidatus Heimdallarchaeota archaeon]